MHDLLGLLLMYSRTVSRIKRVIWVNQVLFQLCSMLLDTHNVLDFIISDDYSYNLSSHLFSQ